MADLILSILKGKSAMQLHKMKPKMQIAQHKGWARAFRMAAWVVAALMVLVFMYCCSSSFLRRETSKPITDDYDDDWLSMESSESSLEVFSLTNLNNSGELAKLNFVHESSDHLYHHVLATPGVQDVKLMIENGDVLLSRRDNDVEIGDTYFDGLACSLSYLDSILRAYHEGRDVLLIVENGMHPTIDFSSRWRAQIDAAPLYWKVLQLGHSSETLTKYAMNVVGDPWVSWIPEGGTAGSAHLISRQGMQDILKHSYLINSVTNQSSWVLDGRNPSCSTPLKAVEMDTYVATTPLVTASASGVNQDVLKNGNGTIQQSPTSIFLYMTMRVLSEEAFQHEMMGLRRDAHYLYQIQRTSQWAVHVSVPTESLLSKIEQAAPMLRPPNVEIYFHVHKARFNKYSFIPRHMDRFDKFDLFLMKDSDQRIAGSAWNSFLLKRGNALVAAPLRRSLSEEWRRQWFQLHEASQWCRETWSCSQLTSIQPALVDFIEQYFVVFDGKFAHWFFPQIVNNTLFMNQTVSWGPDFVWCGAAREYDPKRPSCMLLPVISLHENTHTILRDGSFSNESKSLMEYYSGEEGQFAHWMESSRKWRMLIGNASFRDLRTRCQHEYKEFCNNHLSSFLQSIH